MHSETLTLTRSDIRNWAEVEPEMREFGVPEFVISEVKAEYDATMAAIERDGYVTKTVEVPDLEDIFGGDLLSALEQAASELVSEPEDDGWHGC